MANRRSADPAEMLECGELADPVRWSGDPSVLVGKSGNHHDHVESGLLLESATEGSGDVGRPEVLILDVDQASGASKCLRVGAGDAPLPGRRKRIVRPLRGVCPQDLDGV